VEGLTVTTRTDQPRPRRADVAGNYDLSVDAYEALWWDRSSYWEFATGWGANRVRLNRIDARARLLGRLHTDIDRLAPADFRWEGEIICAVAARG
jgi:hypothetical protein